jgi:hypothetical protein
VIYIFPLLADNSSDDEQAGSRDGFDIEDGPMFHVLHSDSIEGPSLESVTWAQMGGVQPPAVQQFLPVDFVLSDTMGRPCWGRLHCTCGGKVCCLCSCIPDMTGVNIVGETTCPVVRVTDGVLG